MVSQQNTTAPLSERTCPSFATKSTPFADHPLFSFSRTQDEENLLALYGEAQSSIERILDSPGEGCSTPPLPARPLLTTLLSVLRCSRGVHRTRPVLGPNMERRGRPIYVHYLFGSWRRRCTTPACVQWMFGLRRRGPNNGCTPHVPPRLPRGSLAVSTAPRISPTHTHDQTTLTVLIFIRADTATPGAATVLLAAGASRSP